MTALRQPDLVFSLLQFESYGFTPCGILLRDALACFQGSLHRRAF
jgi:hypothetical protein